MLLRLRRAWGHDLMSHPTDWGSEDRTGVPWIQSDWFIHYTTPALGLYWYFTSNYVTNLMLCGFLFSVIVGVGPVIKRYYEHYTNSSDIKTVFNISAAHGQVRLLIFALIHLYGSSYDRKNQS